MSQETKLALVTGFVVYVVLPGLYWATVQNRETIMKVAINACYGGFGLSYAAFERLLERKDIEFDKRKDEEFASLNLVHYYEKGYLGDDAAYLSPYEFYDGEKRADPDLIAVIEEMGDVASGTCAELKIIEIPDGVEFVIEEYDGQEWVAEKHRTWS